MEDFLVQLRQWAEEQSDIRGFLLVGSCARGDARLDSDVDLVILTDCPTRYLDSISFAGNFGSPSKWKKEEKVRTTSLVHSGSLYNARRYDERAD
jgi:hypothetical protein